jgi:hypothetical protein
LTGFIKTQEKGFAATLWWSLSDQLLGQFIKEIAFLHGRRWYQLSTENAVESKAIRFDRDRLIVNLDGIHIIDWV